MPMTNDQLAAGLDSLFGAAASGNTAKLVEAIREWNLTYTNSVTEQYGQNFGVGQPAPANVPNLAAQTQQGGIGYIPGLSGFNADQSLAAQNQYASIADAQAGLTGTFTAPSQSRYSPGTWVVLPAELSGGNGVQYAQVTPSGQIQRMSLQDATARGFQGNATPVGYQEFMQLASAPPTGMPQQTLAGLTAYSNLNTAAQNQAIAESGVTGMYQAPAPVHQPGVANDGSTFFQQDQATQQAYMTRFGGDTNQVLNAWTNDTNQAINQKRASQGLAPLTAYGYGGNPGAQETLAAENQYFTQGMELSNAYGQYYAPGAPGQTGQAGVNNPKVGQSTLAAQQQTYAQQMGLINQAASLQANPFRQQQAIGQMGNLLKGGGVASFSAPNTVAGVGTAGGNTQGGMGYLQQMVDDIKNPDNNNASMQSVLDAIPTPTKLNSVEFLRSAPSTQNMVLQGMQEKYGLDPEDAKSQIKATLPGFTAPQTYGTVRRST